MTIDWNKQLFEQLDWHWRDHLRPRFDGMTDAEYLWEPVPGMWSVRPRAESKPEQSHGPGDFVMEYVFPEPVPAPVTTIAWRLGHLIIGIFGQRAASHFGGPEMSYQTWDYAGTAAEALKQLDEVYAAWSGGVRGLGEEGLARRCGPAEGPYAESSLAELVLHINREAIHHGAEICLLRDLYRAHQGRL